MSRPTDAGNFAEAVYAELGEVYNSDDATNAWTLLIFCGALGQMFQQVDDLAHAPNGAWTGLLDIDQIPDEGLPWFGQFIGVRVDTSLTVDEQKQQIRDHVGWARGRPQTIIKAVQRFLTGSQTVVLVERDTSPYHFEVNTYATETPAALTYNDLYTNYATYQAFYDAYFTYGDYYLLDAQVQILEAILAQKPAGLQFDFVVLPGSPGSYHSYEDLYLDYATYQLVFDDYQTYQDVYINP